MGEQKASYKLMTDWEFTDNLKDWTLKEEHNNQEIGQEFMSEPVIMCIAVWSSEREEGMHI